MQALEARNIPSAAFSSATVSAIRRRRLSRAFPMKQRLVDGPFVGESGDQEFLRPLMQSKVGIASFLLESCC
jgi:hypothetical protein